MSKIVVGQKVPDFSLPSTGDKTFLLSDQAGKKVVLYFYPKDDTPGCTSEGQDFRDLYPEFVGSGADVFGLSRDSIKKHEKFREKFKFEFDLLSDEDEKVCNLFGVLKDKIMYGRKVHGVERSTFLIDADGLLQREWRKVRVKDHVAEVLEAVREL